jgi:hypothetical protein
MALAVLQPLSHAGQLTFRSAAHMLLVRALDTIFVLAAIVRQLLDDLIWSPGCVGNFVSIRSELYNLAPGFCCHCASPRSLPHERRIKLISDKLVSIRAPISVLRQFVYVAPPALCGGLRCAAGISPLFRGPVTGDTNRGRASHSITAAMRALACFACSQSKSAQSLAQARNSMTW